MKRNAGGRSPGCNKTGSRRWIRLPWLTLAYLAVVHWVHFVPDVNFPRSDTIVSALSGFTFCAWCCTIYYSTLRWNKMTDLSADDDDETLTRQNKSVNKSVSLVIKTTWRSTEVLSLERSLIQSSFQFGARTSRWIMLKRHYASPSFYMA